MQHQKLTPNEKTTWSDIFIRYYQLMSYQITLTDPMLNQLMPFNNIFHIVLNYNRHVHRLMTFALSQIELAQFDSDTLDLQIAYQRLQQMNEQYYYEITKFRDEANQITSQPDIALALQETCRRIIMHENVQESLIRDAASLEATLHLKDNKAYQAETLSRIKKESND